MSWLELDDRILDHPKFIRAVKLGGSEAIHLWLGMRAYCGQLLTDGFIPTDMVDEVRGPKDSRKRMVALTALVDVGLLEPDVDKDGYTMHDFLDWSSSRTDVIERRNSARDRKRRSRGTDTVVTEESQRDESGTDTVVTNPRGRVSPPLPSVPLRSGLSLSHHGSDPDARSNGQARMPALPAPHVRPPLARVGAVTPAFLSVFEPYPRQDGKQPAAQAFQEIADEYPGGEAALAASILAAYGRGFLKRHPYAGPNATRPMFDKVLAERRWEDPASAPDNEPAAVRASGYREL